MVVESVLGVLGLLQLLAVHLDGFHCDSSGGGLDLPVGDVAVIVGQPHHDKKYDILISTPCTDSWER